MKTQITPPGIDFVRKSLMNLFLLLTLFFLNPIMNINISAQIPFQSGWPIIFDDICTFNPVVCEDINPKYVEIRF